MSEWRYYVQRAVAGDWLDTDAQVTDDQITAPLSGPANGKLTVPPSAQNLVSPYDGRPVWGKWDTLVYVEIDGALEHVLVVTNAYPNGDGGIQVDLMGAIGWNQRVDYNDAYARWEPNTFDVVRHLLAHANSKPRGLTFAYDNAIMSNTVLGDPEPPNKPRKPNRRKGESKKEYKDSQRYKDWEQDLQDWKDQYGDHERYKIGWWEMPYVGEEIDELAKETGFDWREEYKWLDKAALQPEFRMVFADNMRVRRTDIQFVDGVNIADTLEPKDEDTDYANRVVALGAGEGRKMKNKNGTVNDGRLYQSKFIHRKHVRRGKRLKKFAERAAARASVIDVELGSVVVWDVPGYSPLNSLNLGDEVEVISDHLNPPLRLWCRVTSITRTSTSDLVTVGLQVL